MTHTSKLLDYTISCVIVKDRKVLLIYNDQYDLWLAPGGHIDIDENIEDAIFREVEEETGIKKEDLKLIDIRNSIPEKNIFTDMEGRSLITPTFVDVHQAGNNHYHVGFRYFLTTNAEITRSEDLHVIKHKWFTQQELGNPKYNLKRHVRYYAEYAINYLNLKQ